MASPAKPGLLVALGIGKSKSSKDEDKSVPEAAGSDPEMESKESDSGEFDDAASEAFNAVSSGDLEGFKLALKAAIKACDSYEEE